MGIGVTDEHQALAESVRGWVQRHAPMAATRDLLDEPQVGRDPFWSDLANQGLLGLHVPQEFGGAGASFVDLAVVVEEFGRAMLPGPFMPTVLASTLILLGSESASKTLVPSLVDGSVTAAVALVPSLEARMDDSDLRVAGTVRPVLAAASADLLLVGAMGPDGEVWVVLDADAVSMAPLDSMDPTRPLAEVTVNDVPVPPARILEDLDATLVAEAATAIFSSEAAGLAAWCLDTAVEYAKVREQFGRPIGQFQGVKHLCADVLVRVEQIQAAAWDSVSVLDDPSQRALSCAVAGALALDHCATAADDCIQVLGGIGFTWEHDAHMYYKRAMTLRALLPTSSEVKARVADLALGGARRTFSLELDDSAAAQFRSEVHEFLAGLDGHDEAQQRRAICDAGYAVPHWPKPYGRESGAIEQLVIDQEFSAAGIKRPNLMIAGWVLPTVITAGTDVQRDRLIMPTLYGELVWCQMFSEPGAGSDLASLSMKAISVDGGWLLNGQKVWTSLAHRADWGLCLARTSAEGPKHEGITCFLIDMKSRGLEIRPLREITGAALFNEVFFNDVFVPDDLVVGDVDDGWRLARGTLANERVAMSSGSSMGASVESVLESVASHHGDIDAITRDRVGRLTAEGQVLELLGYRTTLRQLSGVEPGAGSSVRKLAGTIHSQECAELVVDLLGPEGATREGAAKAATYMLLNSRCLTIAGGTTNVQKNVIAERMLGLPRDP